MKKVLILSSSPRRGGNSDRLCDEFLRGAREAGHEAEKIFLRDRRIGYCTGCGACSERGLPCPQQDDAAGIVERMIAADVIVMATPVYFYTMSAQMKTLIDRTCARYLQIRNKEFWFLLAAAETDVAAMERTVEGFRGFLDCLEGACERGVVYGVGAWKMDEIRDKPAMREAYEAGKICSLRGSPPGGGPARPRFGASEVIFGERNDVLRCTAQADHAHIRRFLSTDFSGGLQPVPWPRSAPCAIFRVKPWRPS